MLAYGNALNWRSGTARQNSEFRSMQAALNRMRLDRNPFVPPSIQDYLQHKVHVALDWAGSTMTQYKRDTMNIEMRYKRPLVLLPGGDSFSYSRNRALAIDSIWSTLWQPTVHNPDAPWPSSEEMKEEGDERHTSGFGRFLPIPRVPGNPTVAWKQKQFIEINLMDQVHPVPRRYPIELPNDYEIVELEEDEHGHVIDDPDAPGRTATIEVVQHVGHPKSSKLASKDKDGVFSQPGIDTKYQGQIELRFQTREKSKVSKLNPVALDFAPREVPYQRITGSIVPYADCIDHIRVNDTINDIRYGNQADNTGEHDHNHPDSTSGIDWNSSNGLVMMREPDESHRLRILRKQNDADVNKSMGGNSSADIHHPSSRDTGVYDCLLNGITKASGPRASNIPEQGSRNQDVQAIQQVLQAFNLPSLEKVISVIDGRGHNIHRSTSQRTIDYTSDLGNCHSIGAVPDAIGFSSSYGHSIFSEQHQISQSQKQLHLRVQTDIDTRSWYRVLEMPTSFNPRESKSVFTNSSMSDEASPEHPENLEAEFTSSATRRVPHLDMPLSGIQEDVTGFHLISNMSNSTLKNHAERDLYEVKNTRLAESRFRDFEIPQVDAQNEFGGLEGLMPERCKAFDLEPASQRILAGSIKDFWSNDETIQEIDQHTVVATNNIWDYPLSTCFSTEARTASNFQDTSQPASQEFVSKGMADGSYGYYESDYENAFCLESNNKPGGEMKPGKISPLPWRITHGNGVMKHVTSELLFSRSLPSSERTRLRSPFCEDQVRSYDSLKYERAAYVSSSDSFKSSSGKALFHLPDHLFL